jgi:hypothetical protein
MSTGANSCSTKDLPKGREGTTKKAGPIIIRPRSRTGSNQLFLFVALLLVEPVFRAREVLRPVIQVEITTPGTIRLIFVVRRCPWEVSACVPWLAVLLAHRVLPAAGTAPCGTISRNAGRGTRVSALQGLYGKSRAEPSGKSSNLVISMAFRPKFRGGLGHPR